MLWQFRISGFVCLHKPCSRFGVQTHEDLYTAFMNGPNLHGLRMCVKEACKGMLKPSLRFVIKFMQLKLNSNHNRFTLSRRFRHFIGRESPQDPRSLLVFA